MDKNFASGLEAGLESIAEVHQEFLGQEDMDEDDFDAVFHQLLQTHRTPLAVVTDGRIAFAFARKYGQELFPDAPVIFCSIPRPAPYICRHVKIAQDCRGIFHTGSRRSYFQSTP